VEAIIADSDLSSSNLCFASHLIAAMPL